MSKNTAPIRRLTCCCCGETAGRWHQHWNRDTGWGVCVRCVTAERMRGTSEEDILSDYGTEGVNWGMYIVVYGRAFRVVAAFREHEQDRANEWMTAHSTHALIATHEGLLLLADADDKGIDPKPGMPTVTPVQAGQVNRENNA